jgi:nucleoside-diphosphate-sugar epimerase
MIYPTSDKMRIALFGSTGFVGYNLVSFFINKGYDLTLYGRRFPSLKGVTCVTFDMLAESIPGQLNNFDIIINATGSAVQANNKTPIDEIFQVNLNFPLRLIDELNTINFKGKLFTFGSYFEIGDEVSEIAYDEFQVVFSKNKVTNHYCASKRLFTNYIYSVKSDVDHLHLIIPTIYGENEPQQRLIPYLIDKIRIKEKPVLSSGDQVRQYLYIQDLCLMIEGLIRKNIHLKSGILNLPAFETTSIKNITNDIFKFFGAEVDPSIFGKVQARDGSMKYLMLNTKLYETLNLPTPTYSIIDNIRKYI